MILTEKASKIFKMKYAYNKDESFEAACWRIASYIAQAEKLYGKTDEEVTKIATEFYQYMSEMYFLPGGRIMANSGTGIKNLFNCFTLGISDSRGGIYGALSNAAEIFANGGGLGYNFSHIREEGAMIKSTRGKSSGPLSFMSLFDQTGEVIQQASRRGAQIGILSCNHPDIEKFIKFKSVPNSRNSRLIDDYDRNLKTINEKLKDTKYHKVLRKTLLDDQLTHFNISVGLSNKFMSAVEEGKETWDLVSPATNEVVNTVNPKKLLEDISELSWETGDPGVLFLDRANEDNLVPYVGDIEATNPCITGDTNILTVYDGPVPIKQLADEGNPILVYGWSPITKLPVVSVMNKPRLTRKNAHILEVEFDSGLKVRCTDDHNFYSFRGNKIMAKDLRTNISIRAFTVSIPPDGHMRAHAFVNNKARHQYVARLVWEHFYGKIEGDLILHHKDFNKLNNRLENLMLLTNSDHSRIHYSTGHSKAFYKMNHKVVAIRDAGYEDVYNGTVDDVHNYIIADPTSIHGIYSGIVSANCGEVPMTNNEACNLLSLNLPMFYQNGSINFELLECTTRVAVRLLDDVHDVSVTPIDIVNNTNRGLRRIGIGVMGFADLLVKIGIPYNTEDARKLANYLSWFISFISWQESIELAKEKGAFPLYDKDKVNLSVVERTLNSRYNPYKFNMEDIRNTGVRNVSVTSIAPTGTLAIIADVNSGIEPYFALAYKRNITEGIGNVAKDYIIEINPLLFNKLKVSGLSDEDIDKVKEYIVEHGDLSGCELVPDKLKNIFITASQVAWQDHILMQAAWQEFISNAVSKTINCPNDTTKEEIYDMFFFMWKSRLKGSTIYRDGSRMFQVLEKGIKSTTT
jgi:ribonucleoside-diphosphate reductase alpha chain